MTSKYTKSAQGQECQVRIPDVCNGNPETTVFAHINGAGMGLKHADIHGAYACSCCHDALDGRLTIFDDNSKPTYSKSELKLMHYDAMLRTQIIMIKDGILKL